jgi:TPR repeat protein
VSERLDSIKKAASGGDVLAQYNLGTMYYDGDGVPKNYREAEKWLRKAAEQGDTSAQCVLGTIYCNGEGVSQDFVQAYVWWGLAALNGSREGRSLREELTKKMTSSQLREAKKLIAEWAAK